MADAIRVRVASAIGSTPREVGAEMIVGADKLTGTIGGGRLEYDAIAHAMGLLESERQFDKHEVHLGPEIGQCCGGKVELVFEAVSDHAATNQAALPPVFVFGGGHVGRATAIALSPLPVKVQVIETRRDHLRDLPALVKTQELAVPEAAVHSAPPKSSFVVVTHDHALDFFIVEEALRRGDAAYVGMIGSKSKRAVLETRLRSSGIDPAPLVCPIGQIGLGDKRPEVIAAFVVTELLSNIGVQ